MMDWSLTEIARAVGGELRGRDRPCRGVSIDSRSLEADNLFVALAGSHQDGHAFVEAARAGRAGGVLVSRASGIQCESAIIVAEPLSALGMLAHAWRRNLRAPVAAITGSNGKTTVKNMLATILGSNARVLATAGNLNNRIGVPLTLLNGIDDPETIVLELGTSAPGEIALLGAMVEPDLALVTNAQAAHLEGLGTIDQVAREKCALYEALSDRGIAVLSAEDPYAPLWQERIGGRRVVRFGLARGDIRFEAPPRWDAEQKRWHGTVCAAGRSCPFELGLFGRHNTFNALAAIALAWAWSVPIETSARALARFRPAARRLECKTGPGGIEILDDSYNANPQSVMAGIDAALALGRPLWLAIGDLAELGSESIRWHRDLGRAARERGVQRVYATGPATRELIQGFGTGGQWFQTPGALLDQLDRDLAEGPAVILVKGSHSSRMDEIADALSAKGGSDARLAH